MIGTRAHLAATRPASPAFPLWVWTTTYRLLVNNRCKTRHTLTSNHGFGVRRNSSTIVIGTPAAFA